MMSNYNLTYYPKYTYRHNIFDNYLIRMREIYDEAERIQFKREQLDFAKAVLGIRSYWEDYRYHRG